jgi:hypothetical protein
MTLGKMGRVNQNRFCKNNGREISKTQVNAYSERRKDLF